MNVGTVVVLPVSVWVNFVLMGHLKFLCICFSSGRVQTVFVSSKGEFQTVFANDKKPHIKQPAALWEWKAEAICPPLAPAPHV